jgi:carbamoyl-phosphate synthase large subunit
MESEKIAVSGVGGGVGQSIIKALYETDYQIVGLDGETTATGLYAVPKGYHIPYACNEQFIPRLTKVLRDERCSLMFPGMDAELPKLAANKALIEEHSGTCVVVSRPEVVEIADNKLLTTYFLEKIGLPAPRTHVLMQVLGGAAHIDFPFIIKPMSGGARSKDVHKINSARDLERWLPTIEPAEFVAQEYIEGDEYTCGTVSFDGECLGTITMRRILRDGDTVKSFVEFNPAIDKVLRQVLAELRPFGPMNIQLRMREGIPYIFEVNARCSGTTAARAISGFNEPRIVADFLLHGKRPEFQIKKTTIFRYWKELVIDEQCLQTMQTCETCDNPDFIQL